MTYAYDSAGNVTQLTDARAITVAYSYDALNRLTLTDTPGTAGPKSGTELRHPQFHGHPDRCPSPK